MKPTVFSIADLLPIEPFIPPLTNMEIGVEPISLSTMQTRYHCELCGWTFIEDSTRPREALEAVLRAHLETHDVVEWLRVISDLHQRIDAAQQALKGEEE